MNPSGKFPTKSERIERLERELRIAKAELNSCRDALDRKPATEIINDETPVTDRATFEVLSTLQSGTIKVVRAELAKRFERELNDSKEKIKYLQEDLVRERIKTSR